MANNATFDSDIEDDRRSTYAVDSDDESLLNVDSPADGYFENRDHPQATFIENPSHQSQDKAQEADEERQLSRSVPTAPQSHSTATSRQSAGLDESVPLLDAGPAPPDYYQATGGRGAPPPQAFGRDAGYGSISPPSAQEQGQPRESLDEAGTSQNPVPFGSNHPLVRNGLFSERGVATSRSQEPQSMRDATASTHVPQPQTSSQSVPEGNSTLRENNADRTNAGGDEESGLEPASPYRDMNHPYHHHNDRHWSMHRYSKKHKRWRKFCSCIPRMKCLNVFLIIVLIVILIMVEMGPPDEEDNHDPHWKLPVDQPSSPGDTLPIPGHTNTAQCTYDSTSEYEAFHFYEPGNFTFVEMIEPGSFSDLAMAGVRIGGTMRIAPFRNASDVVGGKDVAIRLWVHAAVTSPWTIKQLSYAKEADTFQLGFPEVSVRLSDAPGSEIQGWEQPCLDFSVLIEVRTDIEIQNWDLTTANLNVEVMNGLFEDSDYRIELIESAEDDRVLSSVRQDGLALTNSSSIDAVRGKVHAVYWSSRRTRISTTSGAISGTYALRDSLEVESFSGSIDIGVEPKKAAKHDPEDAPADLVVKSLSGSLNVECPARHDQLQYSVPERQYRTAVDTHSSSINGRYLLGESTSIRSFSGTISANVLPVTPNEWNQSLHTSTTSSTTNLNLLEALPAKSFAVAGRIDLDPPPQRPWLKSPIHSVHKSISGAMNLRYPSDWSGIIEGRSYSGSINIDGKGIEIIEDEDRIGYHKLKAKKGNGNSTLTFKTSTSSVNIHVDDNDYDEE